MIAIPLILAIVGVIVSVREIILDLRRSRWNWPAYVLYCVSICAIIICVGKLG